MALPGARGMSLLLLIVTVVSLAALFYIYAGYALIIALLARLWPRPARKADMQPRISLIISAYNEAPFVAEKIKNTLALDYPADQLQIIFSSDGSTDGTERIARETGGDRVLVLHHPERMGKPAAMNRGLAAADGEILLFSDARPLYAKDALIKLVRGFADPEVGLINGNLIYRRTDGSDIGGHNNAYGAFENWVRRNETACGSTMTIHGAMLAVRRELIDEIPGHMVNDDAYIALKVLGWGRRLIYEPEAVLTAPAPVRVAGDFERRCRISAGRFQLLFTKGLMPRQYPDALWRYWSHKMGRLLLPLFLVLAFVPGALGLCLLNGPSWALDALKLLILPQLAFYLLALLGVALHLAGLKAGPLSLPFYIVRGSLAPAVGLYRVLTGRQGVTWTKTRRQGA